MDHHAYAHARPSTPLAFNTLRCNVLVASCSIVGLAYLILSCVVLKASLSRAHRPHPHHFSSDRTRTCPRWMRTVEVIGSFLVVPFWPVTIPYFVWGEIRCQITDQEKHVKEEEERQRQERVRQQQQQQQGRKFGSSGGDNAQPLSLQFGGRPVQLEAVDRCEEIVIVSEGPDGGPSIRVFREIF